MGIKPLSPVWLFLLGSLALLLQGGVSVMQEVNLLLDFRVFNLPVRVNRLPFMLLLAAVFALYSLYYALPVMQQPVVQRLGYLHFAVSIVAVIVLVNLLFYLGIGLPHRYYDSDYMYQASQHPWAHYLLGVAVSVFSVMQLLPPVVFLLAGRRNKRQEA